MKKENAERYCIYINKDLMKQFKIYCIQKGISVSELIEKLMKEQLK